MWVGATSQLSSSLAVAASFYNVEKFTSTYAHVRTHGTCPAPRINVGSKRVLGGHESTSRERRTAGGSVDNSDMGMEIRRRVGQRLGRRLPDEI